MEKTKSKSSRIGAIVILLFVLVCSTLILMEMRQNLINELGDQPVQAVIESTVDDVFPIPTRDPNYTPEPIIDA